MSKREVIAWLIYVILFGLVVYFVGLGLLGSCFIGGVLG